MMIYLDCIRCLITDLDVERRHALYFELETDDLPQRTRFIELHSDTEWRVTCWNRQPVLGTASQSVTR